MKSPSSNGIGQGGAYLLGTGNQDHVSGPVDERAQLAARPAGHHDLACFGDGLNAADYIFRNSGQPPQVTLFRGVGFRGDFVVQVAIARVIVQVVRVADGIQSFGGTVEHLRAIRDHVLEKLQGLLAGLGYHRRHIPGGQSLHRSLNDRVIDHPCGIADRHGG